MNDPVPPSDNRHEIAADVFEMLVSVAVAKGLGPHQFRAWFHGSVLAAFLIQVPDDFWQEMATIEECERPGCNCHIESQELHHALDLFRTQYKARAKKFDQAN